MRSDWFFGRTDRSPRQLVDDCDGGGDANRDVELPCNPGCAGLVPVPAPPAPETPCETELNTVCSRVDGCFNCAMLHLRQLFDAHCTFDQIVKLCSLGPAHDTGPAPPDIGLRLP